MTCKDAINSDISSEEKELYLVSEVTSYNKDFKFDLEGTTDQDEKNGYKFLIQGKKCFFNF
jgi:hypothetical protein